MTVNVQRGLGAALLLAGLVLTILIAGGCSSGANAASASVADATSGRVTLRARDQMSFDPPTLKARAGQPVEVTLINDGQIVHDIVLTEGVSQPFKLEAAGKQTVSGSFTLERPGTYTYICAQPGHEAAGMKGRIIVE